MTRNWIGFYFCHIASFPLNCFHHDLDPCSVWEHFVRYLRTCHSILFSIIFPLFNNLWHQNWTHTHTHKWYASLLSRLRLRYFDLICLFVILLVVYVYPPMHAHVCQYSIEKSNIIFVLFGRLVIFFGFVLFFNINSL